MAGLLDLFKQDPRNRQAEDSAYTLGRLDPFQQSAVREEQARQGVDRGVRRTLGALTGQDTRTPEEQRTDAIAAVKAEISQLGLDANDPASMDQFYRRTIAALQKNGLAAEALAVAKEYQAEKLANQKEARASRGQEAKDKFYSDKLAVMRAGTRAAQMEAYVDVLNRLQADPSDPALINMRRAMEATLGIKERNGIKVVPSTKTQKGGAYRQAADGSWKFEAEDEMNRSVPLGGDSGKGGGTEKERTRAEMLRIEAAIRDGTATQQERDWLQAVYDERAPKDKQPLEGEMQMTSALAQLESVQSEFKDEYGSGLRAFVPDVLQGLVTAAEARIGTNVGENEWWSRYAIWRNAMLKAMSGAAVTKPEQERFNEAAPQRGMTPEVIRGRLKAQADIARIGLEAAAAKRKAPRRAVPGASAPIGGEAAAKAPAKAPAKAAMEGRGTRDNPYKPRTQADYDAIPSGGVYLRSDGRPARKK